MYFDLLNDQALTPQLLRASKPMYALAATIPPPTCLTGGATASGEHDDILRSLARLPGNHTLRFTHVAIGLDVMDECPDTDGHFRRYISERHRGRIRDFSLGDREDPDCSHLSVAAVRLMESVRGRLVASWNKAVASAVSTSSQHPKPSMTLTSMPAIPVTPAVGKFWRITEKAPPPQPSKRASFFKGTLEQARLAGLADEEIASIAVAPKPVLEKEEKSGDSGRSVKRGSSSETR